MCEKKSNTREGNFQETIELINKSIPSNPTPTFSEHLKVCENRHGITFDVKEKEVVLVGLEE